MPSVTINGQSIDAPVGSTLFEAAAQAGIRVPTSCVAQGKCKECIVEVTDGMEMLEPRSSHERHLKGDFRLSCQCRILESDGAIQCHTMRRGRMRIERHALNLPASGSTVSLDPAVVRQGSRVVDRITGKVFGESADPIHGLAMDLGTTTVVLRLMNLENGELVADA